MRLTAFATAMLLLLSAAMAVRAEDSPQKVTPCAPVYGTWRTAYIMDKYGHPEPLAPSPGWPGLIMEARIDKDKAVLTWFGGKKKMTFKRWYKYQQTDFDFDGLSSDGGYLGVATEYETDIKYPSYSCYIKLMYQYKIDTIHPIFDHLILMEEIK